MTVDGTVRGSAMAAGLPDRPRTLEQLVGLIDERAPAVRYARTYRKRRPAAWPRVKGRQGLDCPC